MWQGKRIGNLGLRVYDCLGAWDSPLECCIADAIADAIAGTWKHAKQTYTQHWNRTSNAKASFRVHLMFQDHKTRSQSHGLQAGSAFMKR
jgi:hypothetical protein